MKNDFNDQLMEYKKDIKEKEQSLQCKLLFFKLVELYILLILGNDIFLIILNFYMKI